MSDWFDESPLWMVKRRERRAPSLLHHFQMRNPKHRALWLIAEAANFPAVRQNDLLHNGETEASAFLMRGEVRLENFFAFVRWHAGTIIANFNGCYRTVSLRDNLDASAFAHSLRGIEHEV